MLRKIHPAGRNVSVNNSWLFALTFLPAGWILRSIVNFLVFLPLDKGHVPENLWKLRVTYLFEDTGFPIGG